MLYADGCAYVVAHEQVRHCAMHESEAAMFSLAKPELDPNRGVAIELVNASVLLHV
jgi:hypothetical protein